MNPHDAERDRIVSLGAALSFQCDGCRVFYALPQAAVKMATEFQYEGIRADVAVFDACDALLGVIEVIDTHPPSFNAMAIQARLGFAYRRVRHKAGWFWFCSDSCRIRGIDWPSRIRGMPWDLRRDALPKVPAAILPEPLWYSFPEVPSRCGECARFCCTNPLSPVEFYDWADSTMEVLCVECAVRCFPEGEAQWQSPGEILSDDPRLLYEGGVDVEAAVLVYRLGNAGFQRMVWRSRRDNPTDYDGSKHQAAEAATGRQLEAIDSLLAQGDYLAAARLLLPIAAPSWSWLADEGERMLAFGRDNCTRVAGAWERVFDYIVASLPPALAQAREEGIRNVSIPY